MKAKSNIQMTFMCDQNWDAMKVTSCGRYCEVCNKEVFDFTKKPFMELDQYKNQELCGRFLPEQIDLSLIKPLQFPFAKKIALYFSTLIFTMSSQDTNAKNDKPKIEIVASQNNSDILSNNSDDFRKKTNQSLKGDPDKPFLTTKKHSYYWSKKFPFIRIERKHIMGRYVKFL